MDTVFNFITKHPIAALFIFFILLGFVYPSNEPNRKAEADITREAQSHSVDLSSSESWQSMITQEYGKTSFAGTSGGLRDDRHNGIDIEATNGAPIYAPDNGRVVFAGNTDKYCPNKSYGKFLMVDHGHGYTYLYAHLSKFGTTNTNIKKGEIVGYVGKTGFTTGPHLHLSIFKTNTLKLVEDSCGTRLSGEDVDPLKYLD